MNKSNVFIVENAKQVRKESEKIKVTVNRELGLSLKLMGTQRGAWGGWEEGCVGFELPQRARFQE